MCAPRTLYAARGSARARRRRREENYRDFRNDNRTRRDNTIIFLHLLQRNINLLQLPLSFWPYFSDLLLPNLYARWWKIGVDLIILYFLEYLIWIDVVSPVLIKNPRGFLTSLPYLMSSIFTFWYSVYFFDDLQHELLGIIIDRGAATQVCDYFRRNAGISSGKLSPVEIFDSLASFLN